VRSVIVEFGTEDGMTISSVASYILLTFAADWAETNLLIPQKGNSNCLTRSAEKQIKHIQWFGCIAKFKELMLF